MSSNIGIKKNHSGEGTEKETTYEKESAEVNAGDITPDTTVKQLGEMAGKDGDGAPWMLLGGLALGGLILYGLSKAGESKVEEKKE